MVTLWSWYTTPNSCALDGGVGCVKNLFFEYSLVEMRILVAENDVLIGLDPAGITVAQAAMAAIPQHHPCILYVRNLFRLMLVGT